jgi:PHP domain
MSRRMFLTRAGALTLGIVAAQLWMPHRAFANDPYATGLWLAGDHHIHTKYSPDGQYDILEQVAAAKAHGLSWCVITDHGGPMHHKYAVENAYPELLAARKKYPDMVIFQGLEWNVPEAEHGSIIIPYSPDEAKIIAEFEVRYDQLNISRKNTPANTEADAVAGVKYLQSLKPAPIFIANHPARRGRNSPIEIRNWSDAGPDVAKGFEGAAGHQAATLVGQPRGHYEKSQAKDSWPAYPKESYRTWNGYDWYVAKIGGLWDSLLGEGRAWYITTNSDSHRHYTDHTIVNTLTYATHGHVTPTTQKADKPENIDFWPGEYNKTWVYAKSADPSDILTALRSGSMFASHGDLVDRLELTATCDDTVAIMGSSLMLEQPGQDVIVRIRLRVPTKPNFSGRTVKLHHVDLIAGDILGPAPDRATITNPTTKLVKTFEASEAQRDGEWCTFTHVFKNVKQSFYIRTRATNRNLPEPQMDSSNDLNPWDDLWCYSNPVMIRMMP